jgi:hypothetical protein
MDNSDEELMDYGNQLKRSIFEAYSGILQGFKDSKPELMLPHAGHLFQFIELVFREKYRYLVLFHSFSSAASFPFTLIYTHTHTLHLFVHI